MSDDDQNYYRQRAETELELAQRAQRPETVSAHYRLAEAYLERVASCDEPRSERM